MKWKKIFRFKKMGHTGKFDTREKVIMKYEWIDEFLFRKKGVTKDLQADGNRIRYQIGGE